MGLDTNERIERENRNRGTNCEMIKIQKEEVRSSYNNACWLQVLEGMK